VSVSSLATDDQSLAPAGLWTVDELARYLRVSPKTLRRRIADGTIPVIRVGGAGRAIRIDPLVVLDKLGALGAFEAREEDG
jgi:excisionase family DNA binding protein